MEALEEFESDLSHSVAMCTSWEALLDVAKQPDVQIHQKALLLSKGKKLWDRDESTREQFSARYINEVFATS